MPLYRHKSYRRRRRIPKWGWGALGLVVVVALLIGLGAYSKHIYEQNLLAVSDSQKSQVVEIKSGSSVKEIAAQLEDDKLIRSAAAFEVYVRTKKVSAQLQAGSFAFSPSEDVATIVSVLTSGRTSNELVTIYPGKRIDQVRNELINFGFQPNDVDQALNNLSQYSDLPVMSYKPVDINSLEGLLWPDSWDKDAGSSASDIVRQSLDEMGKHLTPDVQAAFAAEGLTPYQGLTLTSVVSQEVNKPTDQAQAAQVFLSRLKSGGKLGSDVTALYGSITATGVPNLNYDSPYNTLIHPGLPPTPISTITASALTAVEHPAGTNWLYFVTGDDGTTYFSTTYQEHQAQTQKYCHKLCGQ
ncbi:MAG TPA: endolytic transglycosylase MltG [Candidatus Saccharimonadia bacterium]|nr:endolytic transglycosylase MltG [Candidatus Saccharimonadia bacterium]